MTALASGSPAPSIAAAILVPQDRIARRPLAPWAAELTDRLDGVRRRVRRTHKLASELAGIGNQASLIAASRGDNDTAWRLTARQLWWQGRLARRSGDAAIAAYAVQPWVNLGRLEALTGRWREALARFAGLGNYAIADTLQLGCVQLRGPAWSALTSSRRDFVRLLETVYVSDSLKALLLNKQYGLVPGFTKPFADGGFRWICEEACVVAECRAGNPRAAAARARVAAREARGWDRVVLRMRAAEAHAVAGETDRAIAILVRLADVVRQVSPASLANPQFLPAMARLAGACREAEAGDEAYALARAVLRGARTAHDETVEIEMLRLLADTAPEREREAWNNELRAAEKSTEYARYRSGGPPPADPSITALVDRLEEAFS